MLTHFVLIAEIHLTAMSCCSAVNCHARCVFHAEGRDQLPVLEEDGEHPQYSIDQDVFRRLNDRQ